MFERLKFLKAWIQCFLENTRAEGSITGKAGVVIGMIITAIIYVNLIPTFVEAVTGIDTSGWNFTGATGAIAILLLLPLIFIAGIVIWMVTTVID